jgi:dTDP-4-amino-4,6-dideoxygalactose transaminase
MRWCWCLRAKNIGPGDAVLVPSFTFASTAEVVALVGATPIFADVRENDFNMCAKSLEQALQVAKDKGLTPRCVISVDIFGQPAAYNEIETFCKANNLWLMSDAAQSFGASLSGPQGRHDRPCHDDQLSSRPSRWVAMAMAVQSSLTMTSWPRS